VKLLVSILNLFILIPNNEIMDGYLPLTFIHNKVKDLQNALFFSLNDTLLKIPTCVIRVLGTDQLGRVWFFIPKPKQSIYAFEKVFPAKLDFFKKDREYYLKLYGTAYIISDPEEICHIECLDETIKSQALKSEILLITVHINQAEYVEKSPLHVSSNSKTMIKKVKNKIYHLFQSSKYQLGIDYHNNIPVKLKGYSFPYLSN